MELQVHLSRESLTELNLLSKKYCLHLMSDCRLYRKIIKLWKRQRKEENFERALEALAAEGYTVV